MLIARKVSDSIQLSRKGHTHIHLRMIAAVLGPGPSFDRPTFYVSGGWGTGACVRFDVVWRWSVRGADRIGVGPLLRPLVRAMREQREYLATIPRRLNRRKEIQLYLDQNSLQEASAWRFGQAASRVVEYGHRACESGCYVSRCSKTVSAADWRLRFHLLRAFHRAHRAQGCRELPVRSFSVPSSWRRVARGNARPREIR